MPDEPLDERPATDEDQSDPSVTPDNETDDAPVMPDVSPEDMEKAEQLIRQAHLARIRGQSSMVEKLLVEADQIAGGTPLVLEAQGDDYAERKQFSKAKELYKRAFDLDPTNRTVETKFAELVLRTSGGFDPFSRPQADSGTLASGKAAVVISFFAPGVGQMILEEYVKGGFLSAGWLLGWGVAIGVPDGFENLLKAFFGGGSSDPINPMVYPALALAAVCHVWAIADARARAARMTPMGTIERPVPPSHQDFEL